MSNSVDPPELHGNSPALITLSPDPAAAIPGRFLRREREGSESTHSPETLRESNRCLLTSIRREEYSHFHVMSWEKSCCPRGGAQELSSRRLCSWVAAVLLQPGEWGISGVWPGSWNHSVLKPGRGRAVRGRSWVPSLASPLLRTGQGVKGHLCVSQMHGLHTLASSCTSVRMCFFSTSYSSGPRPGPSAFHSDPDPGSTSVTLGELLPLSGLSIPICKMELTVTTSQGHHRMKWVHTCKWLISLALSHLVHFLVSYSTL